MSVTQQDSIQYLYRSYHAVVKRNASIMCQFNSLSVASPIFNISTKRAYALQHSPAATQVPSPIVCFSPSDWLLRPGRVPARINTCEKTFPLQQVTMRAPHLYEHFIGFGYAPQSNRDAAATLRNEVTTIYTCFKEFPFGVGWGDIASHLLVAPPDFDSRSPCERFGVDSVANRWDSREGL